MRTHLLGTCAVITATITTPAIALADGSGAAPLRVPDSHGVLRETHRAHLAFTLPGGTWTPSTAGVYTDSATAADGTACRLTLTVSGRSQRTRPNIGAALATGGLTGSGTAGSLTWLTGQADGVSIASGDQHLAGSRLLPAADRWTSFVARLSVAPPADAAEPTAACSAIRKAVSLRATITKVHLVAGALPAA
jgi:hypothetical protein